MSRTIAYNDLIFHVKKNMKLLIIFMMVGIAISAIISFTLLSSKYEAKTQILVNQDKGVQEQQYQVTQSDLQLINTYIGILHSPLILNEVIENLRLHTLPTDLSKKVRVTSEENSKIMNIIVEDATAQDAVNIANEIVRVFEKKIPKIMNIKNVNILMEATVLESIKPVFPNHLLNLIVGAISGLVLSILVFIFKQISNKSFSSEEEIIKTLDIPVLGVINKRQDTKRKEKG